jgi:hypothetical protein
VFCEERGLVTCIYLVHLEELLDVIWLTCHDRFLLDLK